MLKKMYLRLVAIILLLTLFVSFIKPVNLYVASNSSQSDSSSNIGLAEVVDYSFVKAYLDPPMLAPYDLNVKSGVVYSGDVYDLMGIEGLVVIGDEEGFIDVYLRFVIGGGGVLEWFFEVTNPNVVITLRYYSTHLAGFVKVGEVEPISSIELSNKSVDYKGELLINFQCRYSGEPFNLTMHWIFFDPSPKPKEVGFTLIKSGKKLIAEGVVENKVPKTYISFPDIPRDWKLKDTYPEVTWDHKIMGFKAIEETTYHLVFAIESYWDYDDSKTISIQLLDSEGEVIDLEEVSAYITPINITTNTSYWYYNRTYRVLNQLPIDLYNVSFTLTFTEQDFNFFEIGGDPSEMQFFYKHTIIPHIVKYWDGKELVVETYIPHIGANSSEKIYILYGNLKGLEFSEIDLGFYGTDFNYSSALEDWINVSGTWTVKQFSSDWCLYTNSTGTMNQAWFKYKYPQQVRYIFDVKTVSYPIRFNLIFRNDSQSYYFFNIAIEESSYLVYTVITLYKNASGTLEKISSTYFQTFSKDIERITFELGVSKQMTYLNVNGVNAISYTFQKNYLYDISLGIQVNGTHFYLSKFHVKNYYDYTPTTKFISKKRANLVKIMGEKRRLLGPISGLGLDELYIEVYDAIGRLGLGEFIEMFQDTSIRVPLSKITFLSSIEGEPTIVYASDNISYWSDIVLPGERKRIYLLTNVSTVVGWKYYNSDSYIETNMTIGNSTEILMTGDSLRDLIHLLTEVNKSIINNLEARIDKLEGNTLLYLNGIEGNLTLVNQTVNYIKVIVEEMNATLYLMNNNISDIVERLTTISNNVRELINLVLELNETQTDTTNETLEIKASVEVIKDNISQILADLAYIEEVLGNQTNILQYLKEKLNATDEKLTQLEEDIDTLLNDINYINETIYTLNQTLLSINSTIEAIVSEINSTLEDIEEYILLLDQSISNLTDITKEFLEGYSIINETVNLILNTTITIYEILVNLNNTILSRINLLINIVNETLQVILIDEFSNTIYNITKHVSRVGENISILLENIKKELINTLKLRRVKIVNSLDKREIVESVFEIKISEYTISPGSLILVASQPEFSIVDYWDRTIPFNMTVKYEVILQVEAGYIYVVNNRLEVLKVSIRPVEILDKTYDVYLRGLDYLYITLPLGEYYIAITTLIGESVAEETVKLESNIFDEKSYIKIITLEEVKEETKNELISTKTLMLAIPATFFMIIIYLIKKSRSPRIYELDEEIEL